MSQADKFRQNAAECQAQAVKSINPVDQQHWLKLAEHWLKLAQATDQNELDE